MPPKKIKRHPEGEYGGRPYDAESAAAASAVGRTPNAAAIGAAAAARSAAEAMSALEATAAAATNPSADAGQTFQRG